MRILPSAEVYDLESQFMPWGRTIAAAEKWICRKTTRRGKYLDLMCGTGGLVRRIHRRRPDLACTGVDMDETFTAHAREQCPEAIWITADVRSWEPPHLFDGITVTGGIHHLKWEEQGPFLRRVRSMAAPGAHIILADPYIREYESETDRKKAAAELGGEYLQATIANGAPDSVIQAAIDLIGNDVFEREYKTSQDRMWLLLADHFRPHTDIRMQQVWPDNSTRYPYGDFYFHIRI